MNFRTDLALEVRENLEGSRIDGVECTSFESAGAEITRLRVTDRRGEEILGKPRGEYITVQSQSFARSSRISDELIDAVAQELSRLLPSEGTVLAAGLFVLNDADEAGYFYHDLVQILGQDQAFFFPSTYKIGRAHV